VTAIIVILLVIAFTGVVIKNLLADSRPSRHNTSTEHLVNVMKKQSHQKLAKPVKNITTSKTKADRTNAKLDTAAVLAGAALVHQIRKHHKHDDANDIDDDRFDSLDDEFDDLYDHDFYDDLDTQDYEDSNYEYERAAYEEEQAAYDDFIASLDMADD